MPVTRGCVKSWDPALLVSNYKSQQDLNLQPPPEFFGGTLPLRHGPSEAFIDVVSADVVLGAILSGYSFEKGANLCFLFFGGI